jgi:hypothetical protein
MALRRSTANDEFQRLIPVERFTSPAIIKVFFWLCVGISALFGLSTIAYGVQLVAVRPGFAVMVLFAGVLCVLAGILFARIVAEFVLVLFRANEHLGAIRKRAEM